MKKSFEIYKVTRIHRSFIKFLSKLFLVNFLRSIRISVAMYRVSVKKKQIHLTTEIRAESTLGTIACMKLRKSPVLRLKTTF